MGVPYDRSIWEGENLNVADGVRDILAPTRIMLLQHFSPEQEPL